MTATSPAGGRITIPFAADAGVAVDGALAADAARFVVHLHRELRNVLRLLAECEAAVRAARQPGSHATVAGLGFGIADGLVGVDDRTRDEVRRVETIRCMSALARLPIAHVNLDRNGAARDQAAAHVWTAAAEEATRAVRASTTHATIASAVAGWAALPQAHRVPWRPLMCKLAALQASLPLPLLPPAPGGLPGDASRPAGFPLSPTLHAVLQWRVSQALARVAQSREIAKLADIGLSMSPLSSDLASRVDGGADAFAAGTGDGDDAVTQAATGLLCHLARVVDEPPLAGFDLDAVIAGRSLPAPSARSPPTTTASFSPPSLSFIPPPFSPTPLRRLVLDTLPPASPAHTRSTLFPTPVPNAVAATSLPRLAGASAAAMARMAVAGPDHVALVRQRQESMAEAARQRAINPLWLQLASTVLAHRLLRAFRIYKSWIRLLPAMIARLRERERAAASRRRALKAVIVSELTFLDAAAPQMAELARLNRAHLSTQRHGDAIREGVMGDAAAAAEAARTSAYAREMKRPLPREWIAARIGGEGAVPVYINARSGMRQRAHPNHAFALHKGAVEAGAIMSAAAVEVSTETASLDADAHSLRLAAAEVHRALYETRRAAMHPYRGSRGVGWATEGSSHLCGSPLSSPRSPTAGSPRALLSPGMGVPAVAHSDGVREDLTRLLLRVTAVVSGSKTKDILLRARGHGVGAVAGAGGGPRVWMGGSGMDSDRAAW